MFSCICGIFLDKAEHAFIVSRLMPVSQSLHVTCFHDWATFAHLMCSIKFMLYISKSVLITIGGLMCVNATCPRPPFTGDQTLPSSPTQMLKRSARRPGGVPSQSEVYSSANVKRIQRVLPEGTFNAMFPRANLGLGPAAGNGPYSYYNFLKAAAMWPAFCNEAANAGVDLDTMCKKEMASMFAHFAQEVGEHDVHSIYPTWQQGLYHFVEMGCSDDPTKSGCEYRGGTCESSTWMGQTWPCPAGIKYFGRGAKQLSYNFNYGPFSYALFKDVNVLLETPSLVVAKDDVNGWMAFASAFWFYMTPQSPKPSMHDAVVGFWIPNTADINGGRRAGFGSLIMIINGGIECGGSVEVQQAANRIEYYKGFLTALSLPAEDPATMTCMRMQQFDASSSAFVPSYWEQSWSSQTCGGSCQLVSYQTGFSIFDDPDALDTPYNKCLSFYFGPTTTADPSVSTTATVSSTPAPAFACSSCSTCLAVPGNSQAASDSQCSACKMGGQSWWPCNVAGLCQCGSTAAPTTTPTVHTTIPAGTTTISTIASTSSSKNVTTSSTNIATSTTTRISTTSCSNCDNCVSVPGNYQAASDSMCSPCARNGQSWWPCNISGLCQCSSVTTTTAKSTSAPSSSAPSTSAPSTTRVTSSALSSGTNPCSRCATCVAIDGNYQAATNAMCAPCGSGTLQQWWPCFETNVCTCA